MRKLLCLVFIAAIFTCASDALAACNGDELKVVISGNEKTKNTTIVRLAKLKGNCVPDGGIDPQQIKQDLLNAHIFSKVEVEVEKEPGLAIVKIIVKDKWSIFPAPVVFTSGEESGGGLMLVETNLLGRKKILVLGGTYSNIGVSVEGIYVDDAIWGSKWIGILRPFYKDRHLIQYDKQDEEIYAFAEKHTMVFGILGYRVTEWLAPGVGLIYRQRDLSSVDDYEAPPECGNANGAMFNLRFGKTNLVDYYDEGFVGTFTFEHTLKQLGADKYLGRMQFDLDAAYPVWKMLFRHTFNGAWMVDGQHDFTDFSRVGGDVGSRGLPTNGLWVANFISVSEQLEQVAFRHKRGVLTVAEFVDCVFTNNTDSLGKRYDAYPGVGLGLRIYLKDLAIPAVGVDAGYGTISENVHISAYIGKSF